MRTRVPFFRPISSNRCTCHKRSTQREHGAAATRISAKARTDEQEDPSATAMRCKERSYQSAVPTVMLALQDFEANSALGVVSPCYTVLFLKGCFLAL